MNIWRGGKRETNHKRLLNDREKNRIDGGMWVGDGLDG